MPRHKTLIAIALALGALAASGEAAAQYWVRPYPRHFVYAYPYPYYDPYRYWAAPGYVVPVYPYRYPPPPVVVERRYAEPVPAPREPQYSYNERSQPQRTAALAERITISAKELFSFDSARLRKPQPRLDEIAEALQGNPQIGQVRITGHTDRIGTEAYNLKLSQKRANAVKEYLVAKGVAPRRLVAVGRGEAEPVVECRETGKAELIKCLEPNRRVEVEPITFPKG